MSKAVGTVKHILKSKLQKSGFSQIGFVIFIFVFICVTCLTLEYYHIFTLTESVETEVSRALNISVIMATQDVDWVEHNSVMDTDTAKREFKQYLRDEMELNNNYEKYDNNGRFLYQLIIENSNIQKSPAKYEVSGQIRMTPVTLKNILTSSFEVPFKASSNNIRTDD